MNIKKIWNNFGSVIFFLSSSAGANLVDLNSLVTPEHEFHLNSSSLNYFYRWILYTENGGAVYDQSPQENNFASVAAALGADFLDKNDYCLMKLQYNTIFLYDDVPNFPIPTRVDKTSYAIQPKIKLIASSMTGASSPSQPTDLITLTWDFHFDGDRTIEKQIEGMPVLVTFVSGQCGVHFIQSSGTPGTFLEIFKKMMRL